MAARARCIMGMGYKRKGTSPARTDDRIILTGPACADDDEQPVVRHTGENTSTLFPDTRTRQPGTKARLQLSAWSLFRVRSQFSGVHGEGESSRCSGRSGMTGPRKLTVHIGITMISNGSPQHGQWPPSSITGEFSGRSSGSEITSARVMYVHTTLPEVGQ